MTQQALYKSTNICSIIFTSMVSFELNKSWLSRLRHPWMVAALTLLVVAATAFASLQLLESYSTRHFHDQYTQLRQDHARLNRAIAALPDADPDNPDALTRNYAGFGSQTAAATADITEATTSLRDGYQRPWLAVFSSEYRYSDIDTTNQQLAEPAQSLQTAAAEHGTAITAMEEFMAYAPAVDLADYSPGSADTQERLQRLQTGLERAESDLATDSGDSQLNGRAQQILDSAQSARQQLHDDEDVEAFTATFQRLQAAWAEAVAQGHPETTERMQHDARTLGRSL